MKQQAAFIEEEKEEITAEKIIRARASKSKSATCDSYSASC